MTDLKTIKLSESFASYVNRNAKKVKTLEPISGINIFVGPNNSGKSRFLRILSNQAEYLVNIQNYSNAKVNEEILTVLNRIEQMLGDNGFSQINNFDISKIQKLKKLPPYFNLNDDIYSEYRTSFIEWIRDDTARSIKGGNFSIAQSVLDKLVKLANEAKEICNTIPIFMNDSGPKKVYIPVLRGLRNVNDQVEDTYAERTYKDYFSPLMDYKPEVFTGLTFYQKLISMLLGDNNDRKTINRYQEFISLAFFENRPVTLIPNINNKIVVVKIGSEKEQPIYNLGDGIQSAIILSFLPFIMKESAFFFIEEPEMFLHPGLQRKIINFFSSQNQHTFFLTTHSNHFLDITIDIKDISVFTFQKQLTNEENNDELTPNFIIEAVDGSENSSLELLGVRNSSVFLVNATIWVEGITDRWYLQAMLNSYVESLEKTNRQETKLDEDVHYSFVEYGGSNITHWSFLDYEEHPIEIDHLCSKAIIIIDYDGNKKEERIKKLKKKMGDRLIILPGREIENLLPPNVIKQIVAKYEGKSVSSISDFDYSSYQYEPLGTFIENVILKNKIARKGGYAEDSGTIKSKVAFCEKARPLIKFEELPKTTQKIIRRIDEFIRKQNS